METDAEGRDSVGSCWSGLWKDSSVSSICGARKVSWMPLVESWKEENRSVNSCRIPKK